MKRGYTLLELIIVLGVICIICSIATISFRALRKIENNINRQTTIQEVEDMVSFARLYCASRKTQGLIVAMDTNGVEFLSGSTTIRKIYVRRGMKIYYVSISKKRWLNVYDNGLLDAGHIRLEDGEGHITEISIRPGSFYDEIQGY